MLRTERKPRKTRIPHIEPMRNDFNKAYYDRFYRDPGTRAVSPAAARKQAAFIASFLRYTEVPVRRIVDIGCGLGHVLAALEDEYPKARVLGVEYSQYLCRKYGWQQGSVVDFQSKQPYDLVVCNDVIAYLDDKSCSEAITNLARLTRSAAFLGILTQEDWELCDQDRTDPDQYLRPKAWYQRRLAKHFVSVGNGLYLKKPLEYPVWTLDRLF